MIKACTRNPFIRLSGPNGEEHVKEVIGSNLEGARVSTSVDFSSQITGWRGGACPTNKGVSYTKIGVWLGCDLKNRFIIIIISSQYLSLV